MSAVLCSAALAGPFTPGTADRATAAIRMAARQPVTGFVRVALSSAHAADGDAEVLGRWLDHAVVPTGVSVTPASEARAAARRSFRTEYKPDQAPVSVSVARQLHLSDVTAAAESLRDTAIIPRRVPPDHTPTELFLAFTLVLAQQTEGPSVRLQALEGPLTLADTTLDGPTTFDPAAVAATAAALHAALPDRIPSALPVGTTLLSAPELLLLFASAVRGDEPPTVGPTSVAEPHEPGLGWGSVR